MAGDPDDHLRPLRQAAERTLCTVAMRAEAARLKRRVAKLRWALAGIEEMRTLPKRAYRLAADALVADTRAARKRSQE